MQVEEEHREKTNFPFLPSAHQVADLLLPEYRFEQSGHNFALRRLYEVSNSVCQSYTAVSIRKRDGGCRLLHIPNSSLKNIQKRILSQILHYAVISSSAMAYRRGTTLKDATALHIGKPVLVKLDIKDFFGSITFQMVISHAFPSQYFPRRIGVLLTNLCCYEGRLPQGAPTSPVISNIIMRPFDDYMNTYCGERGIAYSRYCDDMSFSGDFAPIPLIEKVKNYLMAMGFSLNDSKTQVIRQGHRQTVTGIVVNQKQQVPSGYRRRIRQEIYYCRKYGVRSHILRAGETEYIAKDIHSQDGKRVYRQRYLQHLLGKVNHVLFIDPSNMEFCSYREMINKWINDKQHHTMQENLEPCGGN